MVGAQPGNVGRLAMKLAQAACLCSLMSHRRRRCSSKHNRDEDVEPHECPHVLMQDVEQLHQGVVLTDVNASECLSNAVVRAVRYRVFGI